MLFERKVNIAWLKPSGSHFVYFWFKIVYTLFHLLLPIFLRNPLCLPVRGRYFVKRSADGYVHPAQISTCFFYTLAVCTKFQFFEHFMTFWCYFSTLYTVWLWFCRAKGEGGVTALQARPPSEHGRRASSADRPRFPIPRRGDRRASSADRPRSSVLSRRECTFLPVAAERYRKNATKGLTPFGNLCGLYVAV